MKFYSLLLALFLDALWGDPPNRWHPVAYMGQFITWGQKGAPPTGKFVYGGLLTLLGGGLFGGIGFFLENTAQKLPKPLGVLLQGAALKFLFSVRGLDRAAEAVENALRGGDLPEARRLLMWHLVSRDATTLTESQVAAAAIESVAENTSDGIIAPLLYYQLFGLGGAAAYRFTNTADAMLGYRDAAREWLGKVPARLDDLLNLLPARLTALIFLALGGGWGVWWRDHAQTASPNAGHPMSAAAGALGVELEKVEHYILGAGGRSPNPDDLRRVRGLMLMAVGVFAWGVAVVGRILPQREPNP